MAIIKAISSHAPINTVLDYVTKKEKVEGRFISGIGCSPETVKEEMESTKELYGKTGGRTYKHFVQSFAPGEDITPQRAHEIAFKLADNSKLFKGYEVLIATHQDKNHIHSHFIVNSVKYENGTKFQMSSKDLQNLKDKSDELCRENGLSVCKKGISFDGSERQSVVAWVKEKYQYLKSAFDSENNKSYVWHIKEAVQNAMEKACDIEEYKKILSKQGVSVKWKETRKNVTYIDLDGKKVRDSNLKKTFNLNADKESLLKRFEENKEKMIGNSVCNIQKDIIISKYKVGFYEEVKNSLSHQIEGQRKMLVNINAKISQAESSILKLQADIEKWSAQKEECSNFQIRKRYELQEKIEHGKLLAESIQEDKESFISQYGFSTIEEVEQNKVDLYQAEEILEKIEQKNLSEQVNLQDSLDKYMKYVDGMTQHMQIDLDVIEEARIELQHTFNDDFSEERFLSIVNDANSAGQNEEEEAISRYEERSRS